MESEFITDVESCFLTECQNNNALKCSLLRIRIGADGICMGYEPITMPAEPAISAEPAITE